MPTKRKVLHGVVVSPDDRYAFVTVEGIGSEPGTVEVIDLVALKTVATLESRRALRGLISRCVVQNKAGQDCKILQDSSFTMLLYVSLPGGVVDPFSIFSPSFTIHSPELMSLK